MFLKESVLVEEYEKGCTAESILESLIEFQESFEEAKYEIIQLEYEKTMLESSQEYLMEAEEEKPAEGSSEAPKESLKDKASKMGAVIKEKGGNMYAALEAFVLKIIEKIKGAVFSMLASSDKSWDKLAADLAKKEKVSIVKDASFGKALLSQAANANSVEEITKVLTEIDALKAEKAEETGSTASSVAKARKSLVSGLANSINTTSQGQLSAIKNLIAAEKGKKEQDGAKVSELKKRLSDVAMLASKKIMAVNKMNVKLYSASK
jgi:hypothetical protein